MNKQTRLFLCVMTSALVAAVVQAAPQNSVMPAQVATPPPEQGNVIDTTDHSAQVISMAGTSNVTGNQVTIRSVQTPAAPDTPKPTFAALDTNHDGVISEHEAEAYPPLANDYLYLSRGGHGVSRAEYERWH